MTLNQNLIGVVDYIVIVTSFLALVVIGWISSVKNKGPVTEEGYVLGNRQMHVVPVAFSIAATFLPAYSCTATTGEIYRYGLAIAYFPYFVWFWKLLSAYVLLPVFHQATYTSVFEYLELRYDNTIRRIVSLQYTISSLGTMGVIMYSPAISISSISGIPYWVTVLVGGTICTMYCTMGGFKAVVWTDVLQCILMIGSISLVAFFGVYSAGGISTIWQKGVTETGAALIPLVDTQHRLSFLNLICVTFVSGVSLSVCNQAGVQRILSVKNKVMALRTFLLGGFITISMYVLLHIIGFVFLALYHHCDPKEIPEETGVATDDQLFIFTVTKLMPFPGMVGLAIVALISASLSTISSFINSIATLLMEDFLKPIFSEFFNSENRRIVACKLLTIFFGLITTAISLVVPYLGNSMTVLLIFVSLDGTRVSLIFLGMLSRTANTKSCKIAYVISTIFVTWIVIGSLRVRAQSKTLIHKMDECVGINRTRNFEIGTNDSYFLEYKMDIKITKQSNLKMHQTPENDSHSNPTGELNNDEAFILYRISAFWFVCISFGITGILHFGLSQFIGKEDIPDDKLLSPLFVHLTRRFKTKRVNGSAEMCETIELKSNE